MEIDAQRVIEELLNQNRELNFQIALLRSMLSEQQENDSDEGQTSNA